MAKRREYGEGSIYQRCSRRDGCPDMVDGPLDDAGRPTRVRPDHTCRGLWVGMLEAGWTVEGRRRRVPVYSKHRPKVVSELARRRRELEENGAPAAGARPTVAQWCETWLEIKKTELKPRAYNAAASPVRKWIVPTIGRKRLHALTPADVRAVADAQRKAGVKPAATHRTLMNLLRDAIREGHQVPQRVTMVKAPKTSVSDRTDLSVAESVACLEVAAGRANGSRWALALLYGVRQGEALGLRWSSIDFDAVDEAAGVHGEIHVEWQLDNLPYNVARDRTSGFRVPDAYEVVHLVDAWHLVRPKSKKGHRVLPLTKEFRDALLEWKKVAPTSTHDLVWPELSGRPRNDKRDRDEWWAIQDAARVGRDDVAGIEGDPVRHPSGRRFHIHECRNVTATQLGEAGVDAEVIMSLLGHATAAQSGEYRRIHRAPKAAAIGAVGKVLPFKPKAS